MSCNLMKQKKQLTTNIQPSFNSAGIFNLANTIYNSATHHDIFVEKIRKLSKFFALSWNEEISLVELNYLLL